LVLVSAILFAKLVLTIVFTNIVNIRATGHKKIDKVVLETIDIRTFIYRTVRQWQNILATMAACYSHQCLQCIDAMFVYLTYRLKVGSRSPVCPPAFQKNAGAARPLVDERVVSATYTPPLDT